MARRLLRPLKFPALLLCAAVVLVVARSFRTADYFSHFTRVVAGDRTWGESEWHVALDWGTASYEKKYISPSYLSPEVSDVLARRYRATIDPVFWHVTNRARPTSRRLRHRHGSVWNRLGFAHVRESRPNWSVPPPNEHASVPGPLRGRSLEQVYIAAPVWPLGLLCVLPPGLWLIRARRRLVARRRVRRGLCPDCGYNLTGNQSGVCPECGRGASISM